MPTKTTGAEFKRFYTDKSIWDDLGEDVYHEDEVVTVDGSGWADGYEYIPDASKVKIEGGIVFGVSEDQEEPSFETYFKRWKKKQTIASLVVVFDKRDEQAIRAEFAAMRIRGVKLKVIS